MKKKSVFEELMARRESSLIQPYLESILSIKKVEAMDSVYPLTKALIAIRKKVLQDDINYIDLPSAYIGMRYYLERLIGCFPEKSYKNGWVAWKKSKREKTKKELEEEAFCKKYDFHVRFDLDYLREKILHSWNHDIDIPSAYIGVVYCLKKKLGKLPKIKEKENFNELINYEETS
jgi:hypothetical protein